MGCDKKDVEDCPCCASLVVMIVKGTLNGVKSWRVYCAICQMRTAPEISLRRAKEVWNTRNG